MCVSEMSNIIMSFYNQNRHRVSFYHSINTFNMIQQINDYCHSIIVSIHKHDTAGK